MAWEKGQSGNPSGRPRGAAGLSKYLSDRTDGFRELIDGLLAIARGDVGGGARERLLALTALLDRGIGKPLQTAELRVEAQLGLLPPNWAVMGTAARIAFLDGDRPLLTESEYEDEETADE